VTLLFHRTVTVEVATVSLVYPSQTFTILNSSGYVVAQRQAAVASKVTGRLVWLGVEEGNHVKGGQVIARLESDDVSAQRSQAAANLEVAKANLQHANAELADANLNFARFKDLASQGIVSRAEFDAAEARFRKARASVAAGESSVVASEAALNVAAVGVEHTLIRAPFDAVVLTKDADVGDIVTPLGAATNAKAAVVTIADMRSLLVEADVSESNLAQVKMGQPCEIQLDALPQERFRGIVHMIVPTADRSKASVMVKVRFIDNDPRVLPEMSAKVAFLKREMLPAEKLPRVALSPDVITTVDGRSIVYVVRKGRAIATQVTVGPPIGDLVEVSGVSAGEKVIARPLDGIKDGIAVKVEAP
jgi:RND family efflux transporter MFP subunit